MRQPAEVKHLSKQRKKDRHVIPLVVASERGGAKNLCSFFS